ncbi:MAG TPA: DNA mismatch repair endonuclease MutL [Pirellulales bacterium]|jgi:DNA mismatch repair protein MutL|nr:DNA mismatch repair endonuclease MutL [Pirellulales bacterium]
MPIRPLPQSVINKIAAGEVIERPASVVKELVENALDSGAARIDVSVEAGGVELIRVVDDGCGIAADELSLAVASHATSKLETADDLFRVRTLGFRGEALASIAEISRVVLRSRPRDADAAAQLEINGGAAGAVSPAAGAPGTTVEVRDLFHNTPVRRKFLRATQTEMGHISEAFTRLALAHPQIHFTLKHNDRSIFDLPPCTDWAERIALFFGRELADELIWVESRDAEVTLSGFAARPSQSRSHPRMQYLFLNGRHIRDRSLGHALAEAYRGLLLTGRYGIAFLRIEMPAELVDVNVHPTKLEVRFQDGGRLYSQLLSTLRSKFLTTDLTHRLAPAPAVRQESDLVEWVKHEASAWQAPAAVAAAAEAPWEIDSRQAINDAFPLPQQRPLETVRLDAPVGVAERDERSDIPRHHAAPPPVHARQLPQRALQIHNKYLIAESDEGVVVIDQHALHERILYEQIRTSVLAGALETQQLLVPEPVDLGADEAAAVLERRELLARLGVKVEPFGGSTVLVSSYPAMLARMGPTEVLRTLADHLTRGGRAPERRDLLDEMLHMVACKAAIKAGDPLSAEEIDALLAQRHLAQDQHHCPHGRPTALIFTREELDKQFKRT